MARESAKDAKENGLGDYFRRAFGRPDGTAAERAPERAAERPAERPARRPPGDEVAPTPAPAREAPAAAAPLPASSGDPFSDDAWERRAGELERIVGEKNRRILVLEEEVQRRDARLKEAVLRLREAESTVEAQSRLGDLAAEPSAAMSTAAPDTLARLATEKGTLEAKEKQLRAELAKARSEAAGSAQAAQLLKAHAKALSDTQATLHKREEALAAAQTRLRTVEAQLRDREHGSEVETQRLADEKRRTEESAGAERAAREKLHQLVASAEQQSVLYRKNLIRAEESLRERETELVIVVAERDRLDKELADVSTRAASAEARLGQTAARVATLESGLAAATTAAAEGRDRTRMLEASLDHARAEAMDLAAHLEEQETRTHRLERALAARDETIRELGEKARATDALGAAALERAARSAAEVAAERDAARTQAETLQRSLEEAVAGLAAERARVGLVEDQLDDSRRLASRSLLEAAERLARLEASGGGAPASPPAGTTRRAVGALRRLFGKG